MENEYVCLNCGCSFNNMREMDANDHCPFCDFDLLEQLESHRNNEAEKVKLEEQTRIKKEREREDRKQEKIDRRNAPENIVTTVKGARWWRGNIFSTGQYPGTITITNRRLIYRSGFGSLSKKDCEIDFSSIEKAELINGFYGYIYAKVMLRINCRGEISYEFLVNTGQEEILITSLHDYLEFNANGLL